MEDSMSSTTSLLHCVRESKGISKGRWYIESSMQGSPREVIHFPITEHGAT